MKRYFQQFQFKDLMWLDVKQYIKYRINRIFKIKSIVSRVSPANFDTIYLIMKILLIQYLVYCMY